MRARIATLAVAGALVVAFAARAQVPHGDVATRYDAAVDALVIARVGAANRGARLAARRQQAERMAESRARAGLTEHVDGVLAQAAVPPVVAARVHAALRPEVTGRRFLADGSVVLRMEARAAPLREAWDREDVPWRP